MDTMTVTGPKLLTALLLWECEPNYCREELPLLAGDNAVRRLALGTIFGLATETTIVGAALAGNTGNGAFTLGNPAIAAGARPGVYQAICIEPAADAGTFEVFGPDGVSIGTAAVGVAFSGEVKFTIADGATNFVAGDGFKVTVPGDGTKAVAWSPTALDGSATISGITLAPAVAQDGVDGKVLGLCRGPALIVEAGIAWPDGITTDQKAAARAALADLGIIIRSA